MCCLFFSRGRSYYGGSTDEGERFDSQGGTLEYNTFDVVMYGVLCLSRGCDGVSFFQTKRVCRTSFGATGDSGMTIL